MHGEQNIKMFCYIRKIQTTAILKSAQHKYCVSTKHIWNLSYIHMPATLPALLIQTDWCNNYTAHYINFNGYLLNWETSFVYRLLATNNKRE